MFCFFFSSPAESPRQSFGGALRPGHGPEAAHSAGAGRQDGEGQRTEARTLRHPKDTGRVLEQRQLLRESQLQGCLLRQPGGAHQVCGLLRQVSGAAAAVPLLIEMHRAGGAGPRRSTAAGECEQCQQRIHDAQGASGLGAFPSGPGPPIPPAPGSV